MTMTMADFDNYGPELDFAEFAEWLEAVQEQEYGSGKTEPWWAPVDVDWNAAREADIARRG